MVGYTVLNAVHAGITHFPGVPDKDFMESR